MPVYILRIREKTGGVIKRGGRPYELSPLYYF